MPAVEGNNPKGFWEHLGIFEIQENILSSLSHTWHDIRPLEDEWWKSPHISEQKRNLIKLLLEEFKYKRLWGWKDPRTCLTLPLWLDILRELNTEISFIITLRNPIDTANSLMNRDNLSLNESYLLWHLYMTSALVNTRNYNRVIIHYDHFLHDWKSNLRRCARLLDIQWPHDEKRLIEDMDSFLDPGLRHSHSSLSDLQNKIDNQELPEPIARTYKLCLKAEIDQNFLNSEEFANNIKTIYYEHVVCSSMASSELNNPSQINNELIPANIEKLQ